MVLKMHLYRLAIHIFKHAVQIHARKTFRKFDLVVVPFLLLTKVGLCIVAHDSDDIWSGFTHTRASMKFTNAYPLILRADAEQMFLFNPSLYFWLFNRECHLTRLDRVHHTTHLLNPVQLHFYDVVKR